MQTAARVAAVVVTKAVFVTEQAALMNRLTECLYRTVVLSVLALVLTLLFIPFVQTLHAATLEEERIDIIYHAYEGDDITVDGPAVLVRKNFAEKISVWGRYYEDVVSGASIDVRATASAFVETRTEYSVGADYLYDKTTMNLSYTNSDSGDYISDSYSFGISHDFFGDLTSVALSFGASDETVLQNGADDFEDEVVSQSYALSVSQILTKNIVVGLTAQTIASEGFLNSPYRSVRFLNPDGQSFSLESELYPRTHNSDAVAVRYSQYLPYRASIRGEYRFTTDNWGIDADTYRLDYVHPFEHWTMHLNARYYTQTAADFYSDLFPFANATNVRARDKELSTFNTLSYGIGGSYDVPDAWIPFGQRASVNLFVDRVEYAYDDFRDVTARDENNSPFNPGEEPLFAFDAAVVRFFVSLWY